jgi:hypothetical protein
MYLTYRPGVAADISACMDMLPQGAFRDPELIAALPDIWRRWLRDDEMQLTLMEDEERPKAEWPVAFGCSVFVNDEFVRQIDTSLMPPTPSAVCFQALRGARPQLSIQQIREANCGAGLNLLVLMIGWSPRVTDPGELSRIKAKLLDAFFYTHAGYKIKMAMQEVYSTPELNRALAIGALLLSDYSHIYGDNPPPDETRPYLVGVTLDQAQEGSYLWPIFLYSKPRFSFTSAEQDVLKRALIDQTDAEIAEALCVSLSSIHKRWQSIFDRAGATDVRWLPMHAPVQAVRSGRGVEKRRHLLSYMRAHPEELRPILNSNGAKETEAAR